MPPVLHAFKLFIIRRRIIKMALFLTFLNQSHILPRVFFSKKYFNYSSGYFQGHFKNPKLIRRTFWEHFNMRISLEKIDPWSRNCLSEKWSSVLWKMIFATVFLMFLTSPSVQKRLKNIHTPKQDKFPLVEVSQPGKVSDKSGSYN